MEYDKRDTFTVVSWPESRMLMELDEFNQHVLLINDQELLQEYGPAAYMVRVSWFEDLKADGLI